MLDKHAIEEISIGDYVLTGGEIAALAYDGRERGTQQRLRLLLDHGDQLAEESFSIGNRGLLEAPQFTKPALWDGREIPPVLLSGNHAAIAAWRSGEAERLTQERRPDLWRAYAETHVDPAKDRQRSGASDQSRMYREHDKEPKR